MLLSWGLVNPDSDTSQVCHSHSCGQSQGGSLTSDNDNFELPFPAHEVHILQLSHHPRQREINFFNVPIDLIRELALTQS